MPKFPTGRADTGPQPENVVHYLISWVDIDDKPTHWPPHPQLLGYWKEASESMPEEGKDTPTAVVHMTALIASSALSNGPNATMNLLRELNWVPIRLRRVLTREAGWYPEEGSRYGKPPWADELGRVWGGPKKEST